MHYRLAVVLVVIAFTNAFSQQPNAKTEAPNCCYSERYRKAGWVIPGITGAQKKWRRIAIPESHGVYMTELEPTTHAARIQSFSCSREHAGRVEIEDLDVGIIELRGFDVGGRIFAYNLVYGVDGIAAEWSVRFYDVDGSGLFTLRRSERDRLMPELVPDWVRNGTARRGF